MRTTLTLAGLTLLTASCTGIIHDDGYRPSATAVDDAILADLPHGADQLKVICDRMGHDVVSKKFCGANPAAPRSLAELQEVLGLSFADRSAAGQNGAGGNPAFVLTGHSSSLVARGVSALNPRALVFTPSLRGKGTPDPGFVALGFTRGEQFAEVAAHDPDDDEGRGAINFYLFKFEQACTVAHSCTQGDLYTPAIEQGWTGLTIYEDEDLTNTAFDCTQCHQTAGTDTKSFLRMQERQDPWTHFFKADRVGGAALLADFHAAHGHAEDYGPIPAALIDKSDPSQLAGLVENNGGMIQPNEFKTLAIEAEITASSPAQPAVNDPMGASPTWNSLHAAALAGSAIPVPYHDVKVTDAGKLARLTGAYRSVMAGTMARRDLPELADVFLDQGLADMGFIPHVELDGEALLVAACSQCHNTRLDPMTTRARFDVTQLAAMSRAEKDKAIDRMMRAADDPRIMPPIRFRSMLPEQVQRAITTLAQ